MSAIDMLEVGNPLEKKPKIFVGIALDRSGSMESIASSVISNYNEQIGDIFQRSGKADLKVFLVSFASDVQVHYINANVDNLVKLTKKTYCPDGNTCMFEGMGVLVDSIVEATKDLDDYSVLLVTVSDGENNQSHDKYTATYVRDKIKELQDGKKWTFVFIGATKDKVLIEEELGISRMNVANFVAGNIRSYNTTSRHLATAAANYLDTSIKVAGLGPDASPVMNNMCFFAGEDVQSENTDEIVSDPIDDSLINDPGISLVKKQFSVGSLDNKWRK